MTRRARFVSAVVALLLVLSPMQPAAAACNTIAVSNWASNCYVGYGYDTLGNYVVGIQRILDGKGFYYGGSIDGVFGSGTDFGVKSFQRFHDPDADDGIVGPQTSGWFQDGTELCVTSGGYSYFAVDGGCQTAVYWRLDLSSYYWSARKLNGSWSTWFSMYGPY